MTVIKRKLIEVALPLEAINRESAREKSIRQGHPSTLHLWWARRPLAACRAILFAQLVDDPSADPERFPTEQEQADERQRLFRLIEQLVLWENTNNGDLLRQAHAEIRASSCDGVMPAILDPFAGGGSIPLEAKRLGLEAFANDLNPLPVLINTVLLQVVGRFGLAHPTSGGLGATAQSCLAEDVTFWAAELEARASGRVGGHYPVSPGTGAVPLVYFWARTVDCPNPACPLEIPLVGSWTASGRKNSEAEFRPVVTTDGRFIDVEVIAGKAPSSAPTMERQGGRCPSCGDVFPLAYVKAEGQVGRMGCRLLAVQETDGRSRFFRPATAQDRSAARVTAPEMDWLDAELSTHPQYMAPPRYGLTRFRDLFLPRQLEAMNAFVEELDGLGPDIEAQAERALGTGDARSFLAGGQGAHAYSEAIKILLALTVGRLANRSSTLCIWDAPGQTVQQVFARQAYSMTWFFAEANPFAGASGSFKGQVGYLTKVIERVPMGQGHVSQGPAQAIAAPAGIVVSTDPPYYDSVPYADLSDYFLVWLRRMLLTQIPEAFGTLLAPKAEELVADHVRHGGKLVAAEFFDVGLSSVFDRLRDSHSNDYPMTVYYAFKANDSGWETFLHSLISTGWAISGTWPVRTEQASGLRQVGRNALASSVVVVCRKRDSQAAAVTRRSFISSLKEELPLALRELQQGSIAPVDLAQATIGPGMAIFSRYARVTEADGSDMTVRTALALINQVLDEVLSEQEGDFDADTRFCLKWFSQFGWNETPSGEADVLARAVNTSVARLERGGVFRAAAGRARLLEASDMAAGWDPAADKAISVWEVALRIAHVLQSEGSAKASVLLEASASQVDLETVKELAYLFFSICEKKGWTDSALLINGLVTSWPDLTAVTKAPGSAGAQGLLDLNIDE